MLRYPNCVHHTRFFIFHSQSGCALRYRLVLHRRCWRGFHPKSVRHHPKSGFLRSNEDQAIKGLEAANEKAESAGKALFLAA